jgi:hypothetical protein
MTRGTQEIGNWIARMKSAKIVIGQDSAGQNRLARSTCNLTLGAIVALNVS